MGHSRDGFKTVYAQYRDEGHHVVEMENIIELNTGAPSGNFYIWGSAVSGNRHEYINTTSVTLCMNIINVEKMRFSNDNSTWSTWTDYAETTEWTLPSGDGDIRVYAEFQTNAGTTTYSTNSTVSGNLPVLDTTPPTVTNFQINSGDTEVNHINVNLTYNYTEANTVWAEYRNDGGNWSSQENLSTPATDTLKTKDDWTLKAETGTRDVYIRLSDIAGNVASLYSDDIYLNNVAPAAPVVTAVTPTTSLYPAWSWEPVNGAESYKYCLDSSSWSENITVTEYTPETALMGDMTHTLEVRAVDSEGRESVSGYASVYIDKTAPVISNVTLNGTYFKEGDNVDLSFKVVDNSEIGTLYVVIAGNTIYDVSSSVCTASYTITGNEADGEYPIVIYAEDSLGNSTTLQTESITIDTIAPSVTWFRINNGNTYSCSPVLEAFVIVSDYITESSNIALTITGRNGASYETVSDYYTQSYYDIRSEDGEVTLIVTDEAGNSRILTRTITQKTGPVDIKLEDQTLPSHTGSSAFDLGNMSDYDYDNDYTNPDYNSPSTLEHYTELNLWDEDWYKIYIDGGTNLTFNLWGYNGAQVAGIIDVEFYSDEDGNNKIAASSGNYGTNKIFYLGDYQGANQKTVWIKVLKASAADDYTGVEYYLEWEIDY